MQVLADKAVISPGVHLTYGPGGGLSFSQGIKTALAVCTVFPWTESRQIKTAQRSKLHGKPFLHTDMQTRSS